MKLNAAFWKWFKKSAVVDERGQPLVVYHGTDAKEEFTSFKKGWFTPDREQAAQYGRTYNKRGGRHRIYAVYLSIQNPAIVRGGDIEHLKELGFDGMQIPVPKIDGGGYHWRPFYPSQIKSVENDGTWDVDDPDIRSNPPLMGMPQLWYHGTGSNFTGFDLRHLGVVTRLAGKECLADCYGFSFAASRVRATFFAKRAAEHGFGKPRVITARLRIENPLVVRDFDEARSLTPTQRRGHDAVVIQRHTVIVLDASIIDTVNASGKADYAIQDNPPPAEFWGKAGAGVLFHCTADDTYLLALRSADVEQPGTWGVPGGACGKEGFFREDEGQEISGAVAFDCAKRETVEELSWWPVKWSVREAVVYQKGKFQYTTFVVDVPRIEKKDLALAIRLNWENDSARWFTLPELRKMREDLHFGMQYVLEFMEKRS